MNRETLKKIIVKSYSNNGLLNDGQAQIGLDNLFKDDSYWMIFTQKKYFWSCQTKLDYSTLQGEFVNISTIPAQGLGNARRIVDAWEDIATNTGIELITIPHNMNTEFWNHMNYKTIQADLYILDERLLELAGSNNIFPAYKYL